MYIKSINIYIIKVKCVLQLLIHECVKSIIFLVLHVIGNVKYQSSVDVNRRHAWLSHYGRSNKNYQKRQVVRHFCIFAF